jgi:hypothetical protein
MGPKTLFALVMESRLSPRCDHPVDLGSKPTSDAAQHLLNLGCSSRHNGPNRSLEMVLQCCGGSPHCRHSLR